MAKVTKIVKSSANCATINKNNYAQYLMIRKTTMLHV